MGLPCSSSYHTTYGQENPAFAKTQLIKDPRRRLQAVWELCKGKMVCEGGDLDDFYLPNQQHLHGNQDGGGGQPRRGHGGCGAKQPSLKRDGLKFVATFKSSSAEVRDPCCAPHALFPSVD